MTLTTLAALGPLAVLAGGLLLFNLPTRRAAALALALLAVFSFLPAARSALPFAGWEPWARALPDAVLLAATVAYTLFFGLLLHHLMERSGALEALRPWLLGN